MIKKYTGMVIVVAAVGCRCVFGTEDQTLAVSDTRARDVCTAARKVHDLCCLFQVCGSLGLVTPAHSGQINTLLRMSDNGNGRSQQHAIERILAAKPSAVFGRIIAELDHLYRIITEAIEQEYALKERTEVLDAAAPKTYRGREIPVGEQRSRAILIASRFANEQGDSPEQKVALFNSALGAMAESKAYKSVPVVARWELLEDGWQILTIEGGMTTTDLESGSALATEPDQPSGNRVVPPGSDASAPTTSVSNHDERSPQ